MKKLAEFLWWKAVWTILAIVGALGLIATVLVWSSATYLGTSRFWRLVSGIICLTAFIPLKLLSLFPPLKAHSCELFFF